MTTENRFAYLAGNGKKGTEHGKRGQRRRLSFIDQIQALYPPAKDESEIMEMEKQRLAKHVVEESLRIRQRRARYEK